MTKENGIGGAVVNVSSSVPSHSLRPSARAKEAAEKLEDEVLIKEEEKLMEDEEITSEEEEADENVTERTMISVALMKSVVETRSRSGSKSSHSSAPPDASYQQSASADGTDSCPGSPHRYALRKRRRPSGADLERLEHFHSTNTGGLARITKPDCNKTESQAISSMPPPVNVNNRNKNVRQPPRRQPKVAGISFDSLEAVGNGAASMSETGRHQYMQENYPETEASSHPTLTSSLVPNPLAVPIVEHITSSIAPLSDREANSAAINSTVVPCPLPALPAQAANAVQPSQDTQDKQRKVTINEPVISRKRGFSIDLDLALDFHDDNSESAPSSVGGRDRAFSFECFAFGINADEPLPPLQGSDHYISTRRPRGDSIIFDPVSFQEGGIHEQNALEKPRNPVVATPAGLQVVDATPTKQPAASNPTPEIVAPPAAPTLPSLPPAEPTPVFSESSSNTAPPVSVVTTTITTTSSAGVNAAASDTCSGGLASTASFSLELLNKDGRIGIYLPEARRARIARFHAKRSKRIWRKRIKYDCRKKLADSRPRIKGRFVKRFDKDE